MYKPPKFIRLQLLLKGEVIQLTPKDVKDLVGSLSRIGTYMHNYDGSWWNESCGDTLQGVKINNEWQRICHNNDKTIQIEAKYDSV